MHAPAPSVDLTACDREPIHIPGAIQPHGLLLVADAATLTVVAGAGNIEGRLAPDWLGAPLDVLVKQDVAALLAVEGEARTMGGLPTQGTAERFSVVVHRAGERLLVELEPVLTEPAGAGAVLGWLDAAASGFERASDLQALCERAAIAFRSLTGFDRVMIYRFLDDEAGRVVAEDRAPELHGFLHHHFPASDIPVQARALYVRNRTRAIPDITYVPAPLRPEGFAQLDLSDVGLRSVSPIHIQYLHNMGVAASASISIVKDGLLWGLIACHNYSPRALPYDVRTTAATLASGLARQIRAKEEAETYRERLRLHAAEATLTPRLAVDQTLRRTVEGASDELRHMFAADGFAFVQGRVVDTYGLCPDQGEVSDIARWSRARGALEPFATHELSALLPSARAWTAEASGVLAMPLADDGATLLWFRAELVEEVEWAGNPHKAVTLAPGEILSPRASFESWTETVRGRSRRWTLEEVAAAQRLRRAFAEAHRNQKLLVLNRDLQRALADKDGLIAQKDILMKEVNHRVQNSLQLVSAFLRLQAKAAGDPVVADHLAEAQARLSAVALVHRRLYRDDQVENVDLARYLEELVGDMKGSLGAEWAAQIRLDLAPILMPTDRAVNIGLILTELVINASKYAYAGAVGPIAIALEQHRTRLRLIVADEGRGKSGTGQGFGSRMMDAMVDRLSGEIDFADNAPGLRVILTAPIEEVR
jgi:light-regulated signal transduction histidine kinase (bacteriophytochrome)